MLQAGVIDFLGLREVKLPIIKPAYNNNFCLLLIWLYIKLSTAKSAIHLSFRDEARGRDCLGPEVIGQTTETIEGIWE